MSREPTTDEAAVPLTVLGVRVDLPTQNYALLLLTPSGDVVVPVWVGVPEATAVALVLDGQRPPRPLTHDLLVDAVEALGARVEAAWLSHIRDDAVHARLELTGGRSLDARASDAIAVALRAQAPVLAEPRLVAESGVPVAEAEADDLDTFRRFIDDVDPDDFA